jgi:hypothetical protein
MLQVFYLNVVKVDMKVPYVAIAIYVCFKHMFQVFHLFQTYVVSVSFRYFKKKSWESTCSNDAGGWWPAASCSRLLLLGRRRGLVGHHARLLGCRVHAGT